MYLLPSCRDLLLNLSLALCFSTSDNAEERFRRGFPSPNIFCYCLQFQCQLTSSRCCFLFQASQEPQKGHKDWGCFSCLEKLLLARPECCCEPGNENADSPHRAPLTSEKQKIIPSKTMREDTQLLPSLSQPPVGLLTGDVGRKNRPGREI